MNILNCNTNLKTILLFSIRVSISIHIIYINEYISPPNKVKGK